MLKIPVHQQQMQLDMHAQLNVMREVEDMKQDLDDELEEETYIVEDGLLALDWFDDHATFCDL